MPKDLRNIERINFLHKNNADYLQIVPLRVDASSRKYFRVFLKNGQTRVLADDELKKNKLPEFAKLADFFAAHGLYVPKVYAFDFEKGFLLLEDLGDDTFTKLLQKGEDETFLYELATDALIKIAGIEECPEDVKDLTKERLISDICFFADWYVPMARTTPLTPKEREEFIEYVTPLADLAFKVPNRLVLWDYHVDNIMLPPKQNKCAVIDFQDAMKGPLTYDVMSLLEDARREVSPDVQQNMKEKFFSRLKGVKREDFDDSYAFLSLFRHMRVLGRFTILAYVNGKAQYLRFVGHLWDMLEKTLTYPKFRDFKRWLDKVLPPEKRVIPQRKPIDEAMVLAAGRGIRMRELTDNMPKPLIKVGKKSLIDYNFDRLRQVGIKNVAVNLCYQGDLLKKHLKEFEADFNIKYFVEKEALETGGGIKNALSFFKNEAFFVCNSDVFFEEEPVKAALWRMMDAWDEDKFDVLLLLQDMKHIVGDKGIGDYKIENGVPKRNTLKEPHGFDYMFAGIYIIKKSLFDGVKENKFSSVKLFDVAQNRGRLGFVINKSTFYHVGTPEALNAAEESISQNLDR